MGHWGPTLYFNGVKICPHIESKGFSHLKETDKIDYVVLMDSCGKTDEEATAILEIVRGNLIGKTVGELSDSIAIGRILDAFKHHL